jgi:hypothetical protein
LEKIFGKKKEEASEDISEKKDEILSIEDVETYLSKKFDEKFEPFKETANKTYQEIQSAADDMQKRLNELGEAIFTERVDPELLQNVVSHRTSFIRKMKIMIKQLKAPMPSDFDSIIAYGHSISLAISEANQNTLNDYRFVDRLFEKEGGKTIQSLKAIKKISDNLRSLIKSSIDGISSVRNAQNDLKLVKEETDVLYQMKKNLETVDTKLSELKSRNEKEREDAKKFESGKEWIYFTELLEKRKDTAEKISNLKSQIMQNISGIEKPLKKLKNLVDKEIVKVDDKKTLEKYVNSFLATMIEERSSGTANSILKTLQENISEGKIDMKNRENELAEVKWILENNIFEDFLKKYLLLEDDLKELEKNINKRDEPNIKNRMESEIKDLERQAEITSSEIEKVKKQVDKMENSINERKNSLEESLAVLADKKIELK